MNRFVKTLVIPFSLVLFVACSSEEKPQEEGAAAETEDTDVEVEVETTIVDEDKVAIAELEGKSMNAVTGTATFVDMGNQVVKMTIDVDNLTPGKHALHLHENGDCSAQDASSAGGHWNPEGVKHGERGKGVHHAGDIINLDVDTTGKVTWTKEIDGWTIGGDPSTNILNKAVIIHAGADDFTSQPSGAAGKRVACGVIVEK